MLSHFQHTSLLQLRIAYAGQEIRGDDKAPLQLRENVDQMHVVWRMLGGATWGNAGTAASKELLKQFRQLCKTSHCPVSQLHLMSKTHFSGT